MPIRGVRWKAISPDLTRNDKSKQQPSGGPITLDITSVEYYDTVFALAESPRQQGLLWAGTDDGLIHVSRDDGQNWSNVTPKDMPAWSMVSLIEPSPFDTASAYAAIDRHKLDDLKPLIYRTHDFGKTWTRIVTGIPDGANVHSVREDPARRGLLYAGTELGVFYSPDDGAHWHPLRLNLPVTPVHDLTIKDNDLVAATHGRAFWILDDLSPLRQSADAMAADDFHLLRPAQAWKLHYPDQVERRLPVGDSAPAGAVIDYYLKSKPADREEITLEVLSSDGKLIRHLSNHKDEADVEQPAEWTDREKSSDTIPDAAGANRFVWNLRHDDPVKIPGAFYSDDGPRGPLVMPGHYQLRLTVHGKTQTVPLEVALDPRLKGQISDKDQNELNELSLRTAADIDALHKAVNQIRETRARLETVKKWSSGNGGAKPVIDAANALIAKMAPIEGHLVQVKMAASEDNLRYPNMLNEQYDTFSATLDGEDFGPTEPQQQVFASLHAQLVEELDHWKTLSSTDVPALQSLMREHGVPSIAGGGRPMRKTYRASLLLAGSSITLAGLAASAEVSFESASTALHWRLVGSASRRSNPRRDRGTRASRYFLRRGRQWRRVEDHGRGPHLESHIRCAAHAIHRRHCRRAVQSLDHVCGKRRRTDAPGSIGRRWRVSVRRCRYDLEKSGT